MNNSRPDLNLLVIFDAVASTRSVTAAAERLALSQPAVSHALNRLRDTLGDQLFVRGKSGLLPTPRAQAMAAPVRAVLDAAGAVFAAGVFDAATSVRRFAIGASDYATMTIIPALVREFCSLAPLATLDVLPVGKAILPQLEAGEMDCTFWGAAPPPPPWQARPLYAERLTGMIARGHPLARGLPEQPVTLENYLAFPHAIVSLRNPGKNPVDTALEALGLRRNIAVVTQSFAGVMAALPGSHLIAALPAKLAPAARRQGIVTFDLPLDLSDYEYSLVWHRRADADPALAWFRGLVLRAAAELS
jgi:DNA-binding transcriptional LysR family regulator